MRLLGLVAPTLRGEEQQEFYREGMTVLMDELAEFLVRQRREAERLAPGRTVQQGSEVTHVDAARDVR